MRRFHGISKINYKDEWDFYSVIRYIIDNEGYTEKVEIAEGLILEDAFQMAAELNKFEQKRLNEEFEEIFHPGITEQN